MLHCQKTGDQYPDRTLTVRGGPTSFLKDYIYAGPMTM